MRLATIATAATLIATPALSASLDDVFGLWQIADGAVLIEIAPCGESACGNIAWLAEPTRNDGSIKLDRTNPDPEQRSQPICGMQMLGDFQRGEDSWDDGYVYNPDDGNTYSSTMYVQDDGDLHVRGYLGISLLGKSLIGTRKEGDNGGCSVVSVTN